MCLQYISALACECIAPSCPQCLGNTCSLSLKGSVLLLTHQLPSHSLGLWCSVKAPRVRVLGHIQLFATRWTAATQAPLSIGFPRQQYWRGCHFLFQRLFPPEEIKPESPASPALAGRFFTTVPPGTPLNHSTWGGKSQGVCREPSVYHLLDHHLLTKAATVPFYQVQTSSTSSFQFISKTNRL